MLRKSRKPAPSAPSPACPGFCIDVDCPTCWGWIEKMLADDWFGLTNPKPHPTRVILDLDKPTFAVLQREAADHKTSMETVATVLLQEAAEGIRKAPRRGHLPGDLKEDHQEDAIRVLGLWGSIGSSTQSRPVQQ